MTDGVSDEVFARYVVQAKLATFEHVRAARHAQALSQQTGILLPLADALVSDGAITKAQRDQALKAITGQASIAQVAQYKLLKELGRGGMGKVFLAEDTLAGRQVAIKILPKKLAENKEFISRFRREAKATGKLNHVNIVAAFDAGEEQGRYYYVMEYCAGKPLSQYLAPGKFFPWERAVSIVAQVAQGLKHAHDNSILHRDIKPDNIFLTNDGTAKILDLGLSKDVEDAGSSFTTQSGNAVGTPHYMAPEQAKGDQLDGRADIYALGATFYHLLTGEPPHDGPTPAAVMLKHITDEVPNPQQIQPAVPDSVVMVLRRMMARKPDERYHDCDELLTDLQEVMSGKVPLSVATSNKSMKAAGNGNSRAKTPAMQNSVRRAQPERARSRAMSKLHVGGMVFIGALLLVGCVLVASALNERNKAEKAAALTATGSSTGTATAKEGTSASATGTSVTTAAAAATPTAPTAPTTPGGPAAQLNPFVAPAAPAPVLNRTPAELHESEYLSETAKFERRAQEEYDALEKKLATFTSVEQKVAALDAFEKLYGDSIAGARGRILKSRVTATTPALADPVKTNAATPELAEALTAALKRARACHEQNDFAGALREFDKAIKLDPNQAPMYHNRATTKLALADMEGALADLDQALALGLSRWQVHSLRAIVCFALNREAEYRKSVEQGAKVLAVTPQQFEERIRNDLQHARTVWVGKSFETKTPETALDFVARSQYRVSQGRVADAAEDLKQALALDASIGPKGIFMNLAILSQRLKNYADQLKYLKQWADACPENPDAANAYAWELLTNADTSLRNPKLALQVSEKVGEQTKNQNPMYLDTLALAYFNTGKAQLAAATEEKALGLLPPSANAQERKDYEERLQQFRSALPK